MPAGRVRRATETTEQRAATVTHSPESKRRAAALTMGGGGEVAVTAPGQARPTEVEEGPGPGETNCPVDKFTENINGSFQKKEKR